MELSSGGWSSRPGNSLAEVPMSGDESCPAKRELSGPVIIPLKKGSRKRVVRAIMRSKKKNNKEKLVRAERGFKGQDARGATQSYGYILN